MGGTRTAALLRRALPAPQRPFPRRGILIVLVLVAALAAFVAAVVVWGYPALIVGALIGVGLAGVIILALTADGLFPQKSSAGH